MRLYSPEQFQFIINCWRFGLPGGIPGAHWFLENMNGSLEISKNDDGRHREKPICNTEDPHTESFSASPVNSVLIVQG